MFITNTNHINTNINYRRYRKLTEGQVGQIVRWSFVNAYSVQQMAKKFNVCPSTISSVLQGRTWRDITVPLYKELKAQELGSVE